MRLTVTRLWRAIKRELAVEFGNEQLTSYGGLELLRRYFECVDLGNRIRRTLTGQVSGDYGSTHLVLLVIGLLVVGARRLGHLRYLAHDSLFARFCGLARIPSDRTVVNWLKQFTQTSLHALARLNSELLYAQIAKLDLRRLTIDLDGTVIRTGAKVAWAARGFNPHHPKDKSYYPLLAHLAQTGQILRLKHRPGNVHDSKGVERFVRELISELRAAQEVSSDSGFRIKGNLYYGDHFGFPRESSAVWLQSLCRSRAYRIKRLEQQVVRYLDTLLALNSTRILNDFDEIIRESARRLEAEIRGFLKDVHRTAERRLQHAQSTRAAGASVVKTELDRIEELRARALSLIGDS
jgi:Transposase DDE domain group 1